MTCEHEHPMLKMFRIVSKEILVKLFRIKHALNCFDINKDRSFSIKKRGPGVCSI
jgi:hypothetical protein